MGQILLKRIISFLLLLGLLQTSFARTLIVGVPSMIPPLVMKTGEKGHFTGFDIDLMDEICKRIQADCQYKPLSFVSTLDEVTSGEIDLGIGDITIIPLREVNFLFSLPYLPSFAQYVTRQDSKIRSLTEITGKTIGARHAYVFDPLISQQFGNQVTVINYNNLGDLLNALTSGKVDAIVMEAASAQSIVANVNNLRLLGEELPHGMGYGIIAGKDKQALIKDINQALLSIESDGTYTRIYNTYFSPMN